MPPTSGTTNNNVSQKKLRILVKKLASKAPFKEPPIGNKHISSHVGSTLSNKNIRSASIYTDGKFPHRCQLTTVKNLDMRKKVDGWIHAHIDEMIDVIDGFDKKTQPGRHKDSDLLKEVYFSKRRLADDDTFLMDYVRGTNLKLKPFDATKGSSLKKTKPSVKYSFTKDLTVFSTLNQKELMKRKIYKARKESSASPSVSDFSSSISMLESSPFSCRRGTSPWAKQELSPLSLQNSPHRLIGLSSDYVIDGNVRQFLYIPSAKEDKCHSLCQDSSYSQLLLQRNSLGYKIHVGTMARNYHAEKVATAAAPTDIGKPPSERCTENFGDDFPRENYRHLDDTIFSEQEHASAIASVIVYSASGCSPENWSTAPPSQYVPEGVFPRYGEGLKLSMQRREHAARKDDNGCKWNTEPYDDNFTLHPEALDFRVHTSTNKDIQASINKSSNDIILDIQSSLNHGFCDTSFSTMHRNCIKRQDGSPQPYFCERCMEVPEVSRLHQTDSTVHDWQAPESNTFPQSGLMQVPTVEKPASCTMRKRIYPASTKQITAEGHFDIIPIQRFETPCDTNDERSMKNAESALPANRHIFSASSNNGAHAPKKHFTESTTESNHRKSDLVLKIPCDPLILVPKPIHCLPGPKDSISSRKNHTLSEYKDTFLVKDLSIHQTIDDSCILHGQLYRMHDDGFLVYNFVLNNSEDVLTARGYKLENFSAEKGYSWIYTFQSARNKGKARWRNRGMKDKYISCKMKVCSVLHTEASSSGEVNYSVQSEFVLFDSTVNSNVECQSSRFLSTDVSMRQPSLSCVKPAISSTGFLVASSPPLMIPRHHTLGRLFKKDKLLENAHPIPVKGSPGHRPSFSEDGTNNNLNNLEAVIDRPCLVHTELAGIVINISVGVHDKAFDKVWREAGGWGLKFLEECSETTRLESRAEAAVSFSAINEHLTRGQFMLYHEDQLKGSMDDVRFTSEKNIAKSNLLTCDNKSLQKNDPAIHSVRPNKVQKSMRSVNVTVVLPKGNHSLPSVASNAPSPLIERWKLGGSCDCGGWDLGCGLDIMGTKRSSSCSFRDSVGIMKDNSFGLPTANNPFMIFRQDSKDTVVLSLEVIRDGFFSLSFHSQFSQLQAFAVAVAVLHSKETLQSLGLLEKFNEPMKALSPLQLSR